MRRWFVALCLIGGLTSHAAAGEFELPTLRGSAPFIPEAPKYARWSGFYVGGQVGYGLAQANFAEATASLVAFMLRELALEEEARPSQWQVLGSGSNSGPTFGGFFGYNSQWDDVIVGVDLHYNSAGFSMVAPVSPIGRVVGAGGNTYALTLGGSASMRITDYGAARVRGGWIVGNFLPYATLGFALGRANVSRSATAAGTETTGGGIVTPFSFSSSESRTGAFIYGWSAGGGMDVMLTQNLFLRGEYEYTAFTKIQGIAARISTARFGAGLKF
jgi:outer membrane immunogenic protein